MRVNGALTECNVRGNNLDRESAKKLAKIGTEKGIMLFGIKRDQKEANFQAQNLGPADAILISSDLVTGSLTSLDLSKNQLCGLNKYGNGTYTADGITAIADALRVNGGLTALDLSFNNLNNEGVSAVCEAIQSNKETKLSSLNFGYNGIGPVGANAVAAMVVVTGSLTEVR